MSHTYTLLFLNTCEKVVKVLVALQLLLLLLLLSRFSHVRLCVTP